MRRLTRCCSSSCVREKNRVGIHCAYLHSNYLSSPIVNEESAIWRIWRDCLGGQGHNLRWHELFSKLFRVLNLTEWLNLHFL